MTPILTARRLVMPIANSAIDAAEQALQCRFPAGYRSFLRRYGEAFYCNDIRVYGPARVLEDNTAWRLGDEERYWFWTDGPPLLTRAAARQCIRFVDTVHGDVLACHPDMVDTFFLFPRDEERLHQVRGTFDEALEWLLTSGLCLRPTRARFVEPLLDTRGLCWSGHWQVPDSAREERGALARESFSETVARIAGLEPQSQVLSDTGDHGPIAQVFLPAAETRVRVTTAEYDGLPRFDLISFAATEAREQLLASLRRCGFVLVPA
jgi:hypothetical protein